MTGRDQATSNASHSRSAAGAQADGPVVSIVLPVYNGERFLAAALDSVLAQTFAEIEVIAVDDASTDGSASILDRYASSEPRLRVITHPSNAKLPAALNTGFRAARGRWLTWTSDDNLLDRSMLERLYSAASRSDADIVYAGFRTIDEAGRIVQHHAPGAPDDLVTGNPIGCCFLYKRSVDARLKGYDEALFGVEDYDFWLRAYRAGMSFEALDEELYSYRRHDGSLTSTRAKQIHALSNPIIKSTIETLPRSPRRAFAYANLATRDPYHLKWGMLVRAFRDHPPTVVRHMPHIVRWLRFALRVRLG